MFGRLCRWNCRTYLSKVVSGSHRCLPPTIKHLMANPPAENTVVEALGHVKAVRAFKNLHFVDVSDGSTNQTLNVVLLDTSESAFRVGQSVLFSGKWIRSRGNQDYELQYDPNKSGHRALVVGDVPELYPIQKKAMSYPFLRTLPTLRHRTSTMASILRLRSQLEGLFFRFFEENDVVKVHAPILTSSDCEGAGEQFSVNVTDRDPKDPFFGKPAFLTVSTQLHLEVLSQSLNRVWALTPCFRAENSNTNRHLSEFWMLEAELSHVQSVQQLCDFTEDMVRYVTRDVIERMGDDLVASRYSKEEKEHMAANWQLLVAHKQWPRITYTEAIEIINQVKNKGRLKGRLSWGDDLQTEHEKWLAKDHFKSPIFVTDYPLAQKPFYMPQSGTTERPTVACFDLLVPDIGELVGGSVREHNYDKLKQELEERNMSVEEMDWYLSLRKNGTVAHGGFGLGMERLVAYLAGIANIKDVIAFPRSPGSCSC